VKCETCGQETLVVHDDESTSCYNNLCDDGPHVESQGPVESSGEESSAE
jgi:hypothetical protein